MIIYIFNSEGTSNRYGIGRYCRELVNSLRGIDVQIKVVTLYCNIDEDQRFTEGNVDYIFFPAENGISYMMQKKINQYLENAAMKILSEIEDNSEPVIFYYMLIGFYPFAKRVKKINKNVRNVLAYHSLVWASLQNDPRQIDLIYNNPIHKGYFLEQTRKFPIIKKLNYELSAFDYFLTVTKYGKNDLIYNFEIDENKVFQVYNGVNTDTKRHRKKNLRKKFGLKESDIIITFIGRIEEQKGVHILIKDFIKYLSRSKRDDIHLLLIGGSGQLREFVSMAVPKFPFIHFMGLIQDNNILSEFIEMSDIGVLPSLFEQCSYAVLEMMNHQLPVIISDTMGLNELVENGKQGIVVDLNQKNSLVNAIDLIVNDQNSRKKMGIAAKQRVRDVFDMYNMGKVTIDFFNKIL